MSSRRTNIKAAQLRWLDGDVPFSTDFDDIYFSPTRGAQESDYVFLQANRLASRWRQAVDYFAIGEIGFGTGLNFLLASELWRQSQHQKPHPSKPQLHYFSVEKRPLERSDLVRALGAFPQLARPAQALIEAYPPLIAGHHSLCFANGIILHLLFGEAYSMLSQLRHSDRPEFSQHIRAIDAWFLDGFAPAKNADAWHSALFGLIAQLSAAGSTVSTFSAAGSVRRALQSNGFDTTKRQGFGHKREMLCAELNQTPATSHYQRNKDFPAATWYLTGDKPNADKGSIAIIGAGLAGSTTAEALARRGFHVDVYDSAETLPNGGSGNPASALYSRLSNYASPLNDLSLHAYLYATRFYRQHESAAPTGLLQLLDEHEISQAQALVEHLNTTELLQYLRTDEADAVAGIDLGREALFFPHGRCLAIATLCERLLTNKMIVVHRKHAVAALQRQQGAWRLLDQQGTTLGEANSVIVCGGPLSKRFEQLQWLPTRVIRGQTSLLPSNTQSAQLNTVVCGDSYVTPAVHGQHCIGASYQIDDHGLETRLSENRQNLQAAQAILGSNSPSIDAAAMAAWVGLRCTSPDYLPLVGPAPRHSEFIDTFADLRHDKNKPMAVNAPHHPQLFVNTAYGSRGLCLAPLCAEHLASQLNNELSPLPSPLRHALLPARFLVRQVIRRQSDNLY